MLVRQTPDSRWLVSSPLALGRGVRNILSMQMFTTGNLLGAPNLHSTHPRACDGHARSVATLVAEQAGAAVGADGPTGRRCSAFGPTVRDRPDLIRPDPRRHLRSPREPAP